jgi:hypothetical protein
MQPLSHKMLIYIYTSLSIHVYVYTSLLVLHFFWFIFNTVFAFYFLILFLLSSIFSIFFHVMLDIVHMDVWVLLQVQGFLASGLSSKLKALGLVNQNFN